MIKRIIPALLAISLTAGVMLFATYEAANIISDRMENSLTEVIR